MTEPLLDPLASGLRPEVVILLAGEVDLTVAAPLTDRLLQALHDAGAPCTLVVDASAVTFIDPAGLTPLLLARKVARARGDTLVVRYPSRPVRRLLTILELAPAFFEEPLR